jgi:hypothetical protein
MKPLIAVVNRLRLLLLTSIISIGGMRGLGRRDWFDFEDNSSLRA